MKRKLLDRAAWAVAGALAVALIGSLAGGVRGGPLDPPWPPSSTMKTLEQIRPGTPISQPDSAAGFPIVINTPGSYYLTGNIWGVSGKDGLQINAGSVTLDLNGFELNAWGVAGSLTGIRVTCACNRIEIHDGDVMNWGGNGIDMGPAVISRLRNLWVLGSGGTGVVLGQANWLTDSVVSNNAGDGIVDGGSTVLGNTVQLNAGHGLSTSGSSRIEGNTVQMNTQDGILAAGFNSVLSGNAAWGNGAKGLEVTSGGNYIVKNSAKANPGGNFAIAPGSIVAPIQSAAAATSPLVNASD